MAADDSGRGPQGVITWLAAWLLFAAVFSGCAFRPFERDPVVERVETFEFHLQESDLTREEAARRVAAATRVGEDGQPDSVVSAAPETVEHLAWIAIADQRIDFYRFKTADRSGSVCNLTVFDRGASTAGCGPAPKTIFDSFGSSTGGVFHTAEFYVSRDVAVVVGTAGDGTEYTITPHNGMAFIEWLAERGGLELVAFDDEGVELASHSAS